MIRVGCHQKMIINGGFVCGLDSLVSLFEIGKWCRINRWFSFFWSVMNLRGDHVHKHSLIKGGYIMEISHKWGIFENTYPYVLISRSRKMQERDIVRRIRTCVWRTKIQLINHIHWNTLLVCHWNNYDWKTFYRHILGFFPFSVPITI